MNSNFVHFEEDWTILVTWGVAIFVSFFLKLFLAAEHCQQQHLRKHCQQPKKSFKKGGKNCYPQKMSNFWNFIKASTPANQNLAKVDSHRHTLIILEKSTRNLVSNCQLKLTSHAVRDILSMV